MDLRPSTRSVEYAPYRTAARILGLPRRLIRDAVLSGQLPAQRPGKRIYVRLDDVRAWWESAWSTPEARAKRAAQRRSTNHGKCQT